MRGFAARMVLPATALVTLFFSVGAGQALATHVGCGDTIVADTTLDADLIDCPGDGIVIGAADIALDLNGHTVDGTHVKSYGEPPLVGIDNSAGHDNVEVKGPGIVRQFNVGIMLINASGNVIQRLETRANYFGVFLDGDTARDNVIKRNVAADNASAGIALVDAYALNVDAGYNTVERNTTFGNGYGILTGGYGDGNVFAHNAAHDNYDGILLSDSFGHGLVKDNDFFHNAVGINSIELQNTRIERNRVVENLGNGIEIDDHNNRIEKNDSSRNGADGIRVSGDNTVRHNTANRNGGLGIYGDPGVIDGGGNRAFGNGDPLQCLNVVCK